MKTISLKLPHEEFEIKPVLLMDLYDYMRTVKERIGSAPTRTYMQPKNQDGYTRIRQTKANIFVEWVLY